MNTERGAPRVLLYFDEAHVLAEEEVIPGSAPKFRLDVLFAQLDELRHKPLFALFLSTQLNLDHLAPASSFARSARYRSSAHHLHPPITETPFDCFDTYRLVPSRLTLTMLYDVVFMALFGRPLWVRISWISLYLYLRYSSCKVAIYAAWLYHDDAEGY